MSFRPKQSIPSNRRRSTSAVRHGTGSNGSVSSYSRPRSYVGSHTAPFSSAHLNLPSNTPYSTYTPSSSYKNYGGYVSNYKSPYFQNGYRNSGGGSGSSGYASLTIPAKALSTINIVTPSYSKVYENSREYIKGDGVGHVGRQMTRGGSFTRDSSLTRSQGSAGGMGSRSHSLTSLNSEGYVVRSDKIIFILWFWIHILK